MSWRNDTLSIVIPTFKRPEGIARVLASVEAQTIAGIQIEIVIADNDPDASARAFVTQFAERSPARIVYTHVPAPGVSNARNGALEAAVGRYILFIDDDMEALPGWAQAAFDTADRFGATLVFGPIEAVMPDLENKMFDYMQPLFSRCVEGRDHTLSEPFGSGNSLLDRKLAQLPTPVFDPALNRTGGEDDALFTHIMEQGGVSAWSASALTREYVPAHRATRSYAWRRNFAFGQGPTQSAADRGLRGLPSILKWMSVGTVQIGIYGVRWLAARSLGRPEAVHHMGRLAQGIGKVFWSKHLSPKFYGL